MARSGDKAWQPYDLLDHNSGAERPAYSPEDVIFFASADEGRNWCFFEFDDESYRVGKTDRHHFRPDAYWSAFGNWLLDEIRSLALLFNADGELEIERVNQTTEW